MGHHISIFRDETIIPALPPRDSPVPDNSKDLIQKGVVFDVVGSLCENNDKFAVNRPLHPEPMPGDVAVIHDSGAHGHSMGFNYNGKPRSAEYLYRPDGSTLKIRRAETMDDLFSTVDMAGAEAFGRASSKNGATHDALNKASLSRLALLAGFAVVVITGLRRAAA